MQRRRAGAAVLAAAVVAVVAVVAAPVVAAASAGDAPPRWNTAWASPLVGFAVAPGSAARCTFRLRVHATATSVALQLRSTAGAPVTLAGLAVAAVVPSAPDPVLRAPVTVAGGPAVTLRPDRTVTTDPAAITVAAGDDLLVSFVDETAGVAPTVHPVGLESGRCTDAAGTSSQPAPWFVAAVEVAGGQPACDVAVLGDSISDGLYLPAAADARWTDQVAAASAGRVLVANASLSGNRLLDDSHGPAAVTRLAPDALDLPGVDRLVVEEGTNDLAAGRTATQIVAAYRRIVAVAHQRGLRVIGTTVTPRQGSAGWTPAQERQRVRLDQALRTHGVFDALLDFDRAVAGPRGALRAGFADADHLHLSAAGQHALFASIDVGRALACS